MSYLASLALILGTWLVAFLIAVQIVARFNPYAMWPVFLVNSIGVSGAIIAVSVR